MDLEYYSERQLAEVEAAAAASCERARQVHLSLAQRYSALVNAGTPRSLREANSPSRPVLHIVAPERQAAAR